MEGNRGRGERGTRKEKEAYGKKKKEEREN